MRASSILCATIAVLVLITASASAATTTANKSNFKIGTAAGTSEADCTKKGGTVTTGKDGAKWCTIASNTKNSTRCIIYKAGHEGDDRYCSQSVPN